MDCGLSHPGKNRRNPLGRELGRCMQLYAVLGCWSDVFALVCPIPKEVEKRFN